MAGIIAEGKNPTPCLCFIVGSRILPQGTGFVLSQDVLTSSRTIRCPKVRKI